MNGHVERAAEQLIGPDRNQHASHQELGGCSAILPGGSIRALDTLGRNKRAKACVMKLRKSDAELNDGLKGRSNNSFNRSAG